MEPVPINWFIKKPVLEPVYETSLPALKKKKLNKNFMKNKFLIVYFQNLGFRTIKMIRTFLEEKNI